MLSGHGLGVCIHGGTLVVTHGFTHYPQNSREHGFFPGDPKLPSRTILLSADGRFARLPLRRERSADQSLTFLLSFW